MKLSSTLILTVAGLAAITAAAPSPQGFCEDCTAEFTKCKKWCKYFPWPDHGCDTVCRQKRCADNFCHKTCGWGCPSPP